MNLPQKHSAKGTTIFTIMSALAAEHNAINLSQGFPDFPVDEKLGVLLHEAVLNGYNQYSPMPGLPMLREAIANDVSKRYGVTVDQKQRPSLLIHRTILPGQYGLKRTGITSRL
jgi:methionine transaminase